jgi:DNA polymerase-3 subunit delta
LSNEIKKLANFKKGEKIESKDVKLLVKPTIETAIFETIDAISLQDKKRAISLIHRHLEKGDNPSYLLSMINYQFRNILIIKDLIEKRYPYYSILKTTKLHPFVVKKSYQQAYKFSLQELKKIYQKIFQVDLDIKTGKIEPEIALDLFISSI